MCSVLGAASSDREGIKAEGPIKSARYAAELSSKRKKKHKNNFPPNIYHRNFDQSMSRGSAYEYNRTNSTAVGNAHQIRFRSWELRTLVSASWNVLCGIHTRTARSQHSEHVTISSGCF